MIKIKKGKMLKLQSGTLAARIAPQRHGPMRFITPHAQAEVLGTELDLSVRPESTRLAVWQGRVRFTRLSDRAEVLVGKRESATVRAGDTDPPSASPIHLGLQREYWMKVVQPAPEILAEAPQFKLTPDGADAIADFESPREWADTFLARFRGLLRVPVTGRYTFWVAGDDRAELWLSADDTPARKTRIAFTTTWTSQGDWDQSPSQQSAPIPLEAGRSYYIEAFQQEMYGGDCLSVAWRTPQGAPRGLVPAAALAPVESSDP